MTQTYTSAATSINSVKLPVVYRRIDIQPGDEILDYGCGRYVDHIREYVHERLGMWDGYDPFNYPTDIPEDFRYDTVVCSNVLNVIDSDSVLHEIVGELARRLRKTGTCYISIYEGDKTGNGRPTKADCYQRNERTREYLPLVRRWFDNVEIHGNVIVARHREFI